jgi:outer membrane protein TolC
MRLRLVRGLGWLALCCATAANATSAADGGAVVVSGPPPIPLAGDWEITPSRLLQQVLARNADALYARLQSRVATHLLEAESAIDEPVSFASLRHEDRNRQRTAQDKTANLSLANQDTLDETVNSLELGVRQRLLSGGEVSLSYKYNDRANNLIQASTKKSDEYDGALTITLKHPLLRGYGSSAVDADREVAELEQAISQQQYKQQVLKAGSEALTDYWQLYRAYELLRMRRESRDNAARSLDDVRAQFASGRVAHALVSEAQALFGLRKIEVLRAEQGVTETEAKVKTLLNLSGQRYAGLHLKPTEGPDEASDHYEPLTDRRMNQILEAWPAWKVAQLHRAQGQVRLNYARNQAKPALDVVASCSATRLAYSSGEVTDNTFSTKYPDCYLGLNLEVPLEGNRRAGAQRSAQQTRIGQSDLELEAVRSALANDLVSRREQLTRSLAESAQLREDVSLRAELLDAEKVQMGMGLSRLSQVIERENALNESRARLLESIARQELARAALDMADGNLLSRHGIELGE